MSLLKVSGICKQEEGTYLVKDVSFSQRSFQKIAIAGATGSGKTTLLKIIAGWMQPDAGEVLFEGTRIKGPEEKLMPGHPRIAYLSQHFELLNHYRVEEIVQMTNQLSEEEAERIYAICRIDHLLKRWTHQLSGGEKQRIALARLLVSAPKLLLLDEPYSNLDVLHTTVLKSVINDISERLKITCLLVSHDPVDVLPWADEIIVLQQGHIIQKGAPEEIYNNPVNEYAAALFGKYNIITPALANSFSRVAGAAVRSIKRYVRPEKFKMVADEKEGLKAEVNKISFMGSYYEIETNIAGNNLIIHTTMDNISKGDAIYITLIK